MIPNNLPNDVPSHMRPSTYMSIKKAFSARVLEEFYVVGMSENDLMTLLYKLIFYGRMRGEIWLV